jgi:microcystin degradation protein MlrC
MSKLMELLEEAMHDNEVINASITVGFIYSDVPDATFSVLVTSNASKNIALKWSKKIAQKAWNMRNDFLKEPTLPKKAVAEAILNKKGLCILADIADNPGGGATGDDTTILRALLNARATNSSFGVIADPETVHKAIKAGVGSTVELNVGGKLYSKNSKPLYGRFYVKTISDGKFIYKFQLFKNLPGDMGLTVVLLISGIEIIVTEKRIQVSDAEIFRIMGIEPTDRRIIVVKSAVHFRATFEKIAKGGIWEVDSGGLTSNNLNSFTFKNLPRPIFPLDKKVVYNFSRSF